MQMELGPHELAHVFADLTDPADVARARDTMNPPIVNEKQITDILRVAPNEMLETACRAGSIDLAKCAVSRGTNDFDDELVCARERDNKEIISSMISRDATDFRPTSISNQHPVIKIEPTKVDNPLTSKPTSSTMDYSKMTIKELTALCKEKGMKRYSGKKKADLVDMLSKDITQPVSAPKIEAEIVVTVGSAVKVEIASITEDILSANYWKNTKTFKSIKDKETQIKYYKKMNSCEVVLQLVDLESKPFGSESEKIIQEIFELGPRTSSQNDGTRNGKKIEIKSARYWAGKDDCVWQHLEPDHDYEIALLTLLDFQGWKVWGIKKSLLMGEMRDKKIVTFQGKQGWWVKKSAVVSHLTPIKNIAELDAFIQA